MEKNNSVQFSINGDIYQVSAGERNAGPESRLVDYIRDTAGLKGTKFTCREGGCGACVVTVRTKDPLTGQYITRSVNSCLTPTLSASGWEITTVEALGNAQDGYHPIQKRLIGFGGSQCGFCSSGMVMQMYGLTKQGRNLNSKEIEDSFDGNMCRCTGYRPILEAFKSFATDASADITKKCDDIEDFCKVNANCAEQCEKKCCLQVSTQHWCTFPTGEIWVKAVDLNGAFEALKTFQEKNLKFKVVSGNTGTGVFKEEFSYQAYLDVNSVTELLKKEINPNGVTLGAGNNLTDVIEFMKKLEKTKGYEYAGGIEKHLKRVANLAVRNFGTIAGNLMIKHDHPGFPSDVFLLFETVKATLNISSSASCIKSYNMLDFLKLDMTGKIIVSLNLPPHNENFVFRSFKITKRYQNAHAYVNAAFLLQVDPKQGYKVMQKPSITFGGITHSFLHATQLETFLVGKKLSDPSVLQEAIKHLKTEIEPDTNPPDATPQYRKSLAINLLYKVVLKIIEGDASPKLQSGGADLLKSLQKSKQRFDTNLIEDGPLYKPVVKLEGLHQCSGEAEYTNDIQAQQGELFATFVVSNKANATLEKLDASEALKISGVVTFLTAKDIQGTNDYFMDLFIPGMGKPEPILCEGKIVYAGQPLGIIVARSREIALNAVKKVKVVYSNESKPILTIEASIAEAKAKGYFDKLFYPPLKTPDEPNKNAMHKIKGKFQMGSQHHFHMETHVTLCIPREDGFKIYCATQDISFVQKVISSTLSIDSNLLDIEVRRIGGGFGGKAIPSALPAVACALAATKTRKPVRFVMDLQSNFETMGKREPYLVEYEVSFDSKGKIDGLEVTTISDCGSLTNVPISMFMSPFIQNCYKAQGWIIRAGGVTTNTPSNLFCRAPGTPNMIGTIEYIMEHVAFTLKKDPVEVKTINLMEEGDYLVHRAFPGQHAVDKFEGKNFIPEMIKEMETSGELQERKMALEKFNKENRWQKRGMSMVPMRYPQQYHGMKYPAFVAIYAIDGTVAVTHGGIEMGQGINTKVAQVTANVLGIPLNKVKVKATNNMVSANTFGTVGAITSELVSYAVMRACNILLERMKPVKEKMENPSWEALIKACDRQGVDLRATHLHTASDPVKPYNIWALNVTEVQIDVLTGEFKIIRMDLIEDAGKSLSPLVDIGQVEGCLVMGIGLWTQEKIVYDEITGRMLTNNTWEYKAPFPKCIPEDMRISFMRNAPNPFGVLGSKATGEPPLCTASAVFFAIKAAIAEARKDAGNVEWFDLDAPVTPEDVVKHCLVNPEKFGY